MSHDICYDFDNMKIIDEKKVKELLEQEKSNEKVFNDFWEKLEVVDCSFDDEEYCNSSHSYDSLYKFFEKITKYVEGTVVFKDDYNEHWAIRVKDGAINELNGQVIYGDLIEYVLEKYNLPEKIRKPIIEWKVANKV